MGLVKFFFFCFLESEIMIEGDDKVRSAQSCLVEECSFMCSLADSSLTAMMKTVKDGTVTFMNMEYIVKRMHQVEKLCDSNGGFEMNEVKQILCSRSLECTEFKKYKSRLDLLCSKLQALKLPIQGMFRMQLYMY